MKFVQWGIVLVLAAATSEIVWAADNPSNSSSPAVKSPLSPEDALKSFVLASPNLKVELVAAEPEVVDPVAIAFGADGALWVVEMRDYPYGPKPGSGDKPKSRIKRLLDRDGDGRFETATIFADELLFATGLQPWKDGVIVTLAGEIAFFADCDGDGVAEFKETWFTGFVQENSQLRANHPTLGLDGWVYVANGLRGGTIVAAKPEWKDKGQPVPLAGFDFRFNPLTGEYGAVSGHGQFGLCFDDYGNRFICSNRNPVQHVVLEDHVLKRNPFLAVKKTIHDVAAFAEHSRLYPLSRTWTTSLQHANQFTAACGVQIYRGDALPTEYKGNAFTCDPTGSLVHREILTPTGATFAGKPAYADREFLASPDSWFRPVNLSNGPDGGLYVIDMYRAVIEHPDWVPVELKNRKDLYDGSDKGRIWRVVSADTKPSRSREISPLAKASSEQLVAQLEHPNAWQRDTAARLLLEREVDEATSALTKFVRHGHRAEGRVQALRLLASRGRLAGDLLRDAVQSSEPRLIEHGWRLAAGRASTKVPSVDDGGVRFAVALALAETDGPMSREMAAQAHDLIAAGARDPWFRIAVATWKRERPEGLALNALESWQDNAATVEGARELIEELSEVVGAQLAPTESKSFFHAVLGFKPTKWDDAASLEIRAAAVRGFGQGTARRGNELAPHVQKLDEEEQGAFDVLANQLRAIAIKPGEPAARRISAIKTLRFVSRPEVVTALIELALSGDDVSVRLATLDALASSRDGSLGQRLLAGFDSQTPPLRRAMLDVLLAEEARTVLLVEALERGDVHRVEIDATRQARLTKHRNKELAARAGKLFAANVSPDRAAVLASYQAAIETKGDVVKGRAVFEKTCVTCHRVAGLGVNVGPDISDTYNKTPAYLLQNILDPNRAVDANYFGYTLVTNQGKVYTGLVKAETASSITLRLPEGKEETILRADVEEMKSSGLSLMPVGVEKNITVGQMADLIAFLKNWRYLEDGVPLAE